MFQTDGTLHPRVRVLAIAIRRALLIVADALGELCDLDKRDEKRMAA